MELSKIHCKSSDLREKKGRVSSQQFQPISDRILHLIICLTVSICAHMETFRYSIHPHYRTIDLYGPLHLISRYSIDETIHQASRLSVTGQVSHAESRRNPTTVYRRTLTSNFYAIIAQKSVFSFEDSSARTMILSLIRLNEISSHHLVNQSVF